MRHGISSIELLAALGIASLLATMAVMSITPSLQRGQVNRTANDLAAISMHARRLALQHTPRPGDAASANWHYGVCIWQEDGRSHIGLIHGPTASPEHLLMAGDRPLQRRMLPETVVISHDRGEAAIGWLYAHRSGTVQHEAGPFAASVSIGLPGSPISETLQLNHRNGRHPIDVAVHRLGLTDLQDVE